MKLKNIVAFFLIITLTACAITPAAISVETALPIATALSPSPTIKLTPTKISAITLTQTPFSTLTFTPVPSKRPEGDKISGTYKVNKADGGECVIKVILELLAPFEQIDFELFCILGEPSYNSGGALAKLLFAHNMAVYAPDRSCNIVLEFRNDEIEVTQIGSDFDCGFGHAVYADGIYKLIDNKPPIIGCMRQDNPCGLSVPIP